MEGHQPPILLPLPQTNDGTILPGVKALAFDVFGTCVDWRTTITETLHASLRSKSASSSVPESVRVKIADSLARPDFCGQLAQEWRNEYKAFCHGFVPGVTAWRDIDTLHRESLAALLSAQGLSEAYSDQDIQDLSLAWHHLQPWPDAVEGLQQLGNEGRDSRRRFVTAALSNGNLEILRDLNGHLGSGFRVLVSAAEVGAYKPHPSVYRAAVERLGGEAEEVALVAAHLGDLVGARKCGLRTVYVERKGEDDWSVERREEARGWVDVWVSVDEGGFVELARRLGC
jgi:2-haloacid dehalogenase